MSQKSIRSWDMNHRGGGIETTSTLEAVLSGAARCHTITRFDDETGEKLWERDLCLCGDGLAVGEPIPLAEDRKTAQAVITHQLVELDAEDEDNQFRTHHWKLKLVILDKDGEVENSFDVDPPAPELAGILHDASASVTLNHGDVTGAVGSSAQPLIAPLSWNQMKPLNPGFNGIGDCGRMSGEIPWFYSFRARAWYYDAISFKRKKIFIPRFMNAESLVAYNLETGEKLWEKLGWEEVPQTLCARNDPNTQPIDSIIPAKGHISWKRRWYSPICEMSSTEILVYFEELTQTLNSVSGGPYSTAEFPLDMGVEEATWAGRWQTLGENMNNAVNPLSSDPADAFGDESGFIADLLSSADDELDELHTNGAPEYDVSPRWSEWRHGYMVVNAETGAEVSKSYFSDEVEITAEIDEALLIRRGQRVWEKSTKVSGDLSTRYFGPKANVFGDPPLNQAPDAESLIEDPIRVANQPPNMLVQYHDLLYSDGKPKAGYIGGRFASPCGDDVGIQLHYLYAHGQHTEDEEGEILPHSVRYYLLSPTSRALQVGAASIGPFFFEQAGDYTVGSSPPTFVKQIMSEMHHYRFYTPVVTRKYDKPTPWHSCKAAVCPAGKVVYFFPREAPRSGLIFNSNCGNISVTNTAADVDTTDLRDEHNANVVRNSKVYAVNVRETPVATIWECDLTQVVGAHPNYVGTAGISGVLEPRHACVIGKPLLSDNALYCIVSDYSGASVGAGGRPQDIEFHVAKICALHGEVLDSYQLMGDFAPINPNFETGAISVGDNSYDHLILAACQLWGQAPNARFYVTESCDGSGSGSGCAVGSGGS